MADILNNIEEIIGKDEKIIDIWGKRNPRFEKKYELSVMRVISDYGVGASSHTEVKGKILGAGYEPYILAFFYGLYCNKRLPLSEYSDDVKTLGQPIQFWGNLDSKKNRKAYSGLRSYIFIALVARTDIDWIALDKGVHPFLPQQVGGDGLDLLGRSAVEGGDSDGATDCGRNRVDIVGIVGEDLFQGGDGLLEDLGSGGVLHAVDEGVGLFLLDVG